MLATVAPAAARSCEDVAWAVVQALETPVTIGRQFNISGAAPLTLCGSSASLALGRVRCLPSQPGQ